MVKAWTRWFLIGFIVIVLLIQVVPMGAITQIRLCMLSHPGTTRERGS